MIRDAVMSFKVPTDIDTNNRYIISDISYGYNGTTETSIVITTAKFSYNRSSRCLEMGDPEYGIRSVTFVVNAQGLKSAKSETNVSRLNAYHFNRIYGEK